MPTKSNDSLVMSYLNLRTAVGVIGIILPFTLVVGKMILTGEPGIQSSISAYYYTVMRDVFVGGLWAIGVFLISYHGYEREDEIAGKFATVFAVGTAIFPTFPPNPSSIQIFIGWLHLIFALCLFVTLAYFALVLFRKTNPNKKPTPQKIKRNIIYTICGWGMLSCVALIIFIGLLPANSTIRELNPVFWLEAIAIVLFGLSWFVKGEAILKDEVKGV